MALHQIQEAMNTKSGLVTGVTAIGAGNTIHWWLENVTPYLVAGVQIASILYLTTMFIINLPKVGRILASPFRKDPEEEN